MRKSGDGEIIYSFFIFCISQNDGIIFFTTSLLYPPLPNKGLETCMYVAKSKHRAVEAYLVVLYTV